MTMETLESRRMFASVTGLVLVNADTGEDIAPLKNGATINLATLPTRNLSVRADTTRDTESVKFRLDGKARVESILPYALAGNNDDDYISWTPQIGSHKLSAIAYMRNHARGEGEQVSLTFKVIDEPVSNEPDPRNEPRPEPPTGVTPPKIPGTWKLDWADEFNDNSLDGWRTNIWWGSNAGIGDERTSPANVSVSGGTLNLTATKSGSSYTSGLVTTDDLHEFQYGYVEARIDLPAGVGFWPAFWMLPGNHDDGLGEIDIMEWVGHEPDWFHANYHVDGDGDDTESDRVGFDLSEGYHTYAVNWQKDEITWYIDGNEFHRSKNYTQTPMYVILNLAVGGDWAGSPNDSTQFPSTMKVDYVRVWDNVAA